MVIMNASMRYLIYVLMVFVAGCTSPDEASETNIQKDSRVQVYIIAGQSNAAGYNNIVEYQKGRVEFPGKLLSQRKVLYWHWAGKGQPNSWGVLGVSEKGSFGPEISFAYELSRAMPNERIAIIKCAAGGTGIARSVDYSDYIPALANFDDKGNNWHWPTENRQAGVLYKKLIDNVREAVSALELDGLQYELAGCIWMQGEHEAGISLKMAKDYEGLLAGFISSVRADLKAPSLPFAIGKVNSHSWAFGGIARDGQASYCREDKNAILVETTDLPREGSGGLAHFDADGMVELGGRFAIAISELKAKGNVPE